MILSTVSGMVIDVPVKEGASVTEANNFNPGTTIAFVHPKGMGGVLVELVQSP